MSSSGEWGGKRERERERKCACMCVILLSLPIIHKNNEMKRVKTHERSSVPKPSEEETKPPSLSLFAVHQWMDGPIR